MIRHAAGAEPGGKSVAQFVKRKISDAGPFQGGANLTEAALERNMELGVLIRGGNLPAAIDRLIDALLESGELQAL